MRPSFDNEIYCTSIREDIYGEDVRDSIINSMLEISRVTYLGDADYTVNGISNLARSWHIIRDYGTIPNAEELIY